MKKYGKYIFLGALLTTLSMFSCNACTKHDTVLPPGQSCVDGGCPFEASTSPSTSESMSSLPDSAVEVNVVKHDRLLSGDDWEFNLPPDWEVKPSDSKEILAVAYNNPTKELIMFLKEPYSAAPEGYVIEALRGIKGAGAKITSSHTAELNGVKYTVIESVKDKVVVWAWVTVKNNYGYVFTCGGDEANTESHHQSCDKISLTLKVK